MASPLQTGLALAGTVGFFYALCTLAWALAPETFLTVMNQLFHGMDWSAMVRPGRFAWRGFIEAALVLSAWALLAGMFFAWLLGRLARRSAFGSGGQ